MTDPVAEFRADAHEMSERSAEQEAEIDRVATAHQFPHVFTHTELMWLETRPMSRVYLDAIKPGWRKDRITPLILLTALARILPDDDDGSFSFHPDGQPAVITPVKGLSESPYPGLEITFGDIHDLVAWHPAHDWVYTYCGSPMLGCSYPGIPTVAHKSPLEWFRAGCEGVAVLRW